MYKVAFYPYENDENQYISITKRVIQMQDVELVDLENVLQQKNLAGVDAIYVNWFENGGIKKVLLRLGLFYRCKKHKIKIFYVFHNKRPHDGRLLKLKEIIQRLMLKLSDKIVILSQGSVEYLPKNCAHKTVYIPHPNYVECYRQYIEKGILREGNKEQLNILFVGAVRPYKNIEILISSFKQICENQKNIFLTIAGKPYTSEYEKSLRELIGQEKNISVDFRFIADEEMPELIQKHDILALPYDLKGSLNSGTVLLAFSFGKTVIVPEIATVKEFDKELIYSYNYTSNKDHKEQLYAQLEEVVRDFNNSPEIILEKGKKLFEFVNKENSEEAISKLYRKLFM